MSSTHLLLIALGHCAHSAWEWVCEACSLTCEGLCQIADAICGDGED